MLPAVPTVAPHSTDHELYSSPRLLLSTDVTNVTIVFVDDSRLVVAATVHDSLALEAMFLTRAVWCSAESLAPFQILLQGSSCKGQSPTMNKAALLERLLSPCSETSGPRMSVTNNEGVACCWRKRCSAVSLAVPIIAHNRDSGVWRQAINAVFSRHSLP